MASDSIDPTLRNIKRAVTSALAGLRPCDVTVTEAAVAATQVLYGRRLLEFAQCAGTTLEECGDAYKGISCSPATFATKSQRVQDLGALREALGSAYARASAEWNVARVDLGNDITEVFAATEGIKAYPGVTPEVKAKVIDGSSGLYALREGRKSDRLAAASSTRSANLLFASQQAERTAESASLKDEVKNLKIENKFLSRGALQPEDLSADLITASATLSRPATALAARARRRPGRGPRRTR